MPQTDAILVVNAGSSSLKFQVFAVEDDIPKRLQRGQIDGIGVRPKLTIHDGTGTLLIERVWTQDDVPDLPSAILHMSDWIRGLSDIRLNAIGHRVVHGGPKYATPVRIDSKTLDELAAYQELAPLHQPNNLAPIRLAMQIAPHLPQIACFDTAFHRHHSAHTDCYALPKQYYTDGVRRYGFHGLSYEYIADALPKVAPDLGDGRVIVAHLGSGASMCALKAGVSIDSTMGFTALDGIPMGTRPGQLDPGVVLYLMTHMGMSVDQVTNLLYHDAGLKGLSGISNDMRVLLDCSDNAAKFAIDHFVHRCGLNIGMLAASMGGLDGFVFTAGIGENSPEIRERICEKLNWLGGEMDHKANADTASKISTEASKIGIYVISTDEELVIARETIALLN